MLANHGRVPFTIHTIHKALNHVRRNKAVPRNVNGFSPQPRVGVKSPCRHLDSTVGESRPIL